MTSQEEWRRIAYEESVGRSGNNTMGTQANARGYQQYQEQQRHMQQVSSPTFPASGGGGAYDGGVSARGSSGARWTGGGGGGGGGEGALEALGGGLANISEWFVERVWPLRMVGTLGTWIAGTGWKTRLPVVVLGAYLGGGLLTGVVAGAAAWPWGAAALAGLAGPQAIWIALGLGALAGWVAVPLAGAVLVLAVHLVGLALGLGAIGLVVAAVYAVVAAFAGWPPFDAAGAAGP
jgi:hypothetical protein